MTELAMEVQRIHLEGVFNMMRWTSNSASVVRALKNQEEDGRVIDVHRGKDGQVTRPAVKLAVLNLESNPPQEDAGQLRDVGKKTSFQNHFGSPLQNQFNTKNNTRVIAQKGGLAILPCVVKINSPATVSWIRRKDFQLLTLGLSTHSSDKRFLVEHTRHMGHWSLRIKAVREEDRGFYECQLSIYPTQSIFIELKIVVDRNTP
ncbi:uncharacterized protein Dwil_GK19156 [Drosophila willistoni]|uniref:Ig-like domain-containing protein n=1 Tax=Drosophila willistoni TaxID=7260 RepID=B4N6R6_DROWI|nr:uncharacterized protein Dwil_GK19156 [Drosophila willistoni]